MSDTVIVTPANPKADEWAERIAAQQRSGVSVKQFCKEQGLTDGVLLLLLAETAPGKRAGAVRLGGEERAATGAHGGAPLELVLATGVRLRIGTGVDTATLRAVLDVLRA